jgi:hypothetical protein
MAPSPKRHDEARSEITAPIKNLATGQSACFSIEKPPKSGMIPVSTNLIKDNCFVISWQVQRTTMLVTEAPQWYAYATQVLKANFFFTAIFVVGLLVVLVISRGKRG